jgi:hypothetical protein
MKLLKASFLLAAAATATQLDATDYRIEWSGVSYGNVAKARAIVGLDLTGFNFSGLGFWYPPDSHLVSFNMTVSGNTLGVLNKNYSIGDLNFFIFGHLSHGETMASNLVTQGGGTFPGWLDMRVAAPGGSLWTYGFSMIGDFVGYGDSMKMVYFGPNGVTDVATWMSSIDGQNRIYAAGSTLAGLPLEGAHHRPMLSFDRMGKESQAWATGDFGSSSRTRDVHVTSGEAGINWNVGKSFLFGIAGGHAVQNQDLAFGGSSATKGDFFIAELDYRPEGTQWIVSLLGMVGSWESKTNRGYTNGPSIDFSNGVADTITRSARLRVDAPTVATFGGFGFAPYASYTVTRTIVGAYTETGGGFPASFNEQDHNAAEARLGVTAAKDLSEKTKLLLSVEAIHRFDGVGPALTGQDVTGGVSFSLPGVAPRADCVRFGFDVDHKLSADTLLNVSAHVSTVGEAHDVSAAISIRRAF